MRQYSTESTRQGCVRITNKTSMIYGEKIIIIPEDMKEMFQVYIDVVRPYLQTKGGKQELPPPKPASEQYIFTTQGNDCQMVHKDVSSCLTASFTKAGLLTSHKNLVNFEYYYLIIEKSCPSFSFLFLFILFISVLACDQIFHSYSKLLNYCSNE